MVYFYARVSSKDQNLQRQLEVADAYKKADLVFCDKQSGKNFKRPAYEEMFNALKAGDEVIVKELDRLGRNKKAVKEEIEKMKEKGVTLRILDVPTTLIDFGEQDWIRDMVNSILIEVMASMAEQERVKIGKRQEEGIAAMPVICGKRYSERTHNFAGRPIKRTDEFAEYYQRFKDGCITVGAACTELGISRATWYNRAKQYEEVGVVRYG